MLIKRETDIMEYIYETHLHTVEASACSSTPAADYIDYMLGLGYSGIIVTDHFLNGNSCIDKNLPWEERIRQYCLGYEHALERAKGTDLKVFFGIEFNFRGDEYLLYGVDKQWLLDNPEIMTMTRSELKRAVNEAGGIMIQAHPYRERGYLDTIRLAPNAVDGSEAYNSGNPDYQNAWCYKYAVEHGFLMTGGSDIHRFTQEDMGGMSFPYKLETIQDFVKAFKAGDGTPVVRRNAHDPESVFKPIVEDEKLLVPDQDYTLPVMICDD